MSIILRHASLAALGMHIAERASALLPQNPLLVFPGGSSPAPVFTAMRALESDWFKARITTTDERRVPLDDPQSNAGQIRDFSPLWLCDDLAMQKLDAWAWPIDLLVLGFGLDGHIASLFPGQSREQGEKKLISARSPLPPHERVSLSWPALVSARQIHILAPDPKKIDFIEQISNGAHADTPLAALLAARTETLQIHGVMA
jgi:6-phosphogluconolactonase